jgi:hypothetical protein
MSGFMLVTPRVVQEQRGRGRVKAKETFTSRRVARPALRRTTSADSWPEEPNTKADRQGAPAPTEADDRAAQQGIALIARTLEVWQPLAGGGLTDEDAREILRNMTGFFRVLMTWQAKTAAADGEAA